MTGIYEYEAAIFDVDGTLYHQRPLRLRMFAELVKYYILRLWRWRELYALYLFRKLREKTQECQGDFDSYFYGKTAAQARISDEKTQAVIKKWIFDFPLPFIAKYADAKVIRCFNWYRSQGKKVLVYSDYPAISKLEQLGLGADAVYCASDPGISCLKPCPDGLMFIIKKHDLNPATTIFFGDRYEKDGLCAEKCGVRFCHVKDIAHVEEGKNESPKKLLK
jgi:FMN phosphatase YigB (HAD superfamily)